MVELEGPPRVIAGVVVRSPRREAAETLGACRRGRDLARERGERVARRARAMYHQRSIVLNEKRMDRRWSGDATGERRARRCAS